MHEASKGIQSKWVIVTPLGHWKSVTLTNCHCKRFHCNRLCLYLYRSYTTVLWFVASSVRFRDPVAFENGKSAASRQFLRTHRVSHSYTTHARRKRKEDEYGAEKPLLGGELGLCLVVRDGAWALHMVKCQPFNWAYMARIRGLEKEKIDGADFEKS